MVCGIADDGAPRMNRDSFCLHDIVEHCEQAGAMNAEAEGMCYAEVFVASIEGDMAVLLQTLERLDLRTP